MLGICPRATCSPPLAIRASSRLLVALRRLKSCNKSAGHKSQENRSSQNHHGERRKENQDNLAALSDSPGANSLAGSWWFLSPGSLLITGVAGDSLVTAHYTDWCGHTHSGSSGSGSSSNNRATNPHEPSVPRNHTAATAAVVVRVAVGNMGQDATTSVLKSSVLGTTRVFVVLLAGFLSSKWPKKERESAIIKTRLNHGLLTTRDAMTWYCCVRCNDQ